MRPPGYARDRSSIALDHLRNRLWVIPSLFALGALLVAVGVARWGSLHDATRGVGYFGDRDSAEAMLSTIATAMLTFLGLVFTISVVALQLASGQLSPRVMRIFQRDRVTQVVLGVFLATFVFSLVAIAELGRTHPEAGPPLVGISLLLVAASLVAFIGYLQHITTSLRAVSVIEAIADETRAVIDEMYPSAPAGSVPSAAPTPSPPPRGSGGVVLTSPDPGVIAAVDLTRLVRRASLDDVFVWLLLPVGSYVAAGAPVLEVSGPVADPRPYLRAIDRSPARTLIQDVPFGIRQLVDIAERALSPAVNDPTTALQALDRIWDLLRRIATRPDPPTLAVDDAGTPRVLVSRISWAALVDLAFNEIRWFGRESVQVTRRMASILEDLEAVAPAEKRPALRDAARELAAAVAEALPPSHHHEALRPDPVGLGGVAPDRDETAPGAT